ncbi:MAG: hypothetical protein RLZZ502_583 [Pseudomonadota bacterium]|jgi:ketosteroid isomerase-like protein
MHKTASIFTSAQDAASAYYLAFGKRQLEAMMSVWAEDEDIICIHPGHGPLYGYDAVRASWAGIFSGESSLAEVERLQEQWIETVGLSIQTLVEWIHIRIDDGSVRKIPICVSNTYLRTPQGWRMLSHHASPMPGVLAESLQLNDILGRSKRVLH